MNSTSFGGCNQSVRSIPTLEECKYKFKKGIGLTDEELNILIKHFRTLRDMLASANEPSYRLVLDDVNHNLQIVEMYKHNRD